MWFSMSAQRPVNIESGIHQYIYAAVVGISGSPDAQAQEARVRILPRPLYYRVGCDGIGRHVMLVERAGSNPVIRLWNRWPE